MARRPLVSFVLATHNRAPTLIRTLEHIDACGLERGDFEIHVVDNASSDGTPEQLRRDRPDVHLLALGRNRGSCAKAFALKHARGEYVIFLDDDSHPLERSVERMIAHFEASPTLGAASFMVNLPDGGRECSALPNVFIGCGVGFRQVVLDEVGGLDASYFMQAEEYDLSFRLIQAGYEVRTFPDLQVLHLKSPAARLNKRTLCHDLRNNLMLALTYLPAPWHREFMQDWQQRYRWLLEEAGAVAEYRRWRRSGLLRGYYRRMTRRSHRLSDRAMQKLFGIDTIRERMAWLRKEGMRSVLFAGLGKNVYPYYRAAVEAGVGVEAIMDDRFARAERSYRGINIVSCESGLATRVDAIVISNSSPVHAGLIEQRLRSMTEMPVFRWHGRFEFEVAAEAQLEPAGDG